MSDNLLNKSTSPASSYKVSKSFILTLAIGITFGFSFAHLLLSVTNWERFELFNHSPLHYDMYSNDVSRLSQQSLFSVIPFHIHDGDHGKCVLFLTTMINLQNQNVNQGYK